MNILEITLDAEVSWHNIMKEALITEAESILTENTVLKESNEKSTFQKIKEWIKEQLKKIQNFFRSLKERIRDFVKKCINFIKGNGFNTGESLKEAKQIIDEEEIKVDVKVNFDIDNFEKCIRNHTKNIQIVIDEAKKLFNSDTKFDSKDLIDKHSSSFDEINNLLDGINGDFETINVEFKDYDAAVNTLSNPNSFNFIESLEKSVKNNLSNMDSCLKEEMTPTQTHNINEMKKIEAIAEKAVAQTTNIANAKTQDCLKVVKAVQSKKKRPKDIDVSDLSSEAGRILQRREKNKIPSYFKKAFISCLNQSKTRLSEIGREIDAFQKAGLLTSKSGKLSEQEIFAEIKAINKSEKSDNEKKTLLIKVINNSIRKADMLNMGDLDAIFYAIARIKRRKFFN